MVQLGLLDHKRPETTLREWLKHINMDGNQKVRLEDLPESQNKFWKDADVHTNIVPHSILSESGHYFVRVAGHQAECNICHWGFQLDPGDRITEGHLYDAQKKLVI